MARTAYFTLFLGGGGGGEGVSLDVYVAAYLYRQIIWQLNVEDQNKQIGKIQNKQERHQTKREATKQTRTIHDKYGILQNKETAIGCWWAHNDSLYLYFVSNKCLFCRGAVWGVEGSRLEAWMKSHKSEVAIT